MCLWSIGNKEDTLNTLHKNGEMFLQKNWFEKSIKRYDFDSCSCITNNVILSNVGLCDYIFYYIFNALPSLKFLMKSTSASKCPFAVAKFIFVSDLPQLLFPQRFIKEDIPVTKYVMSPGPIVSRAHSPGPIVYTRDRSSRHLHCIFQKLSKLKKFFGVNF